jgi:hypothetical protein
MDELSVRAALASLVTNNSADFVGYPGLKVDNWVNNH